MYAYKCIQMNLSRMGVLAGILQCKCKNSKFLRNSSRTSLASTTSVFYLEWLTSTIYKAAPCYEAITFVPSLWTGTYSSQMELLNISFAVGLGKECPCHPVGLQVQTHHNADCVQQSKKTQNAILCLIMFCSLVEAMLLLFLRP